MSDETKIRDRVFLRFEDADYYYRSREVEGLRARIGAAAEAKDELAEVKVREELCLLLSSGRDAKWRQKFFTDCLQPMADVFVSREATGCLHDFLGCQAFELGLEEYRAYFDKAVEVGEDSVLVRKPVLKAYPEIVLKWITCRLEKSGRDADVEAKERLLEDVIVSRPDAAEFYLQLARLLRNRYRQPADGYFRKCIRLGCEEVVGNAEFLTSDYESDYVEWFRGLCEKGTDPLEAARLSLRPLWETKRKGAAFSMSHRAYAERLFRDGLKRDAAAEYVRCSEEGYDWAEAWLHLYASDPMVTETVSPSLIGAWLENCKDSIDRQRTLGRCFVRGLGREFRDNPLYYACMARCWLGDEDVMGAVRECLKLDEAAHGGARDVVAQSALDDFPILRRDIRESLRKNASLLVAKEMASTEYDAVVVDELVLDSSLLPPEDVHVLREYFGSGALEVSPFRSNDAQPLCCRYMVLEQLRNLFAGGFGPELGARTARFLQGDFGKLADREFRDSVQRGNPMTTCRWLVDKLFESSDAKERIKGEAALYRMVAKWSRGDDDLLFKILASYWKSASRAPEYTLALRIFLGDDRELKRWLEAADAKDLFKLAYDSVVGTAHS